MKIALMLARRISLGADTGFTRAVARLAMGSGAIGTALLIGAFAILEGYRGSITARVYSFSGHVQAQAYGLPGGAIPWLPTWFIDSLDQMPGVTHVQGFLPAPVLLRSGLESEGVVLRGIGGDFNRAAFADNLIAGRYPAPPTPGSTDSLTLEIVPSQTLAQRLELDVDSTALVLLIQDPPRVRRARVVGLYRTHLEEYDKTYVLAARAPLAGLLGMGDTSVAGLEIFVDYPDRPEPVIEELSARLGPEVYVASARETQAELFEWLDIIGRNVEVMIVLVCLVACINTAGTLLIFTLEKVRLVGLLKAMGMTPRTLGGVFWLLGLSVAGRGMLIGNAVGIAIVLAQQYGRFIKMDPEAYYLEYVPSRLTLSGLLIVNGALAASLALSLAVPVLITLRMPIARALRD